MYQITTSNGVVGYAETVDYCYKLPSGSPQVIGPKERKRGIDATGIVYAAGVYNLPGHSEFEGAETASACLINEVSVLNRQARQIAEQDKVSSIAFVTLAESGGIDDVTAGEHAELFSPWAPDVRYEAGNLRKYESQLYRCVQAHTSQSDWTPDVSASLWVRAADPAEEWPAWAPPVGAHDAYNRGDKVSHDEKRWTSDLDGNVWEPGVHGWTERQAGRP